MTFCISASFNVCERYGCNGAECEIACEMRETSVVFSTSKVNVSHNGKPHKKTPSDQLMYKGKPHCKKTPRNQFM